MTPALAAVGLYAGLNMMILYWMANETGKLRRRHRVLIGDGGNSHLARIIRGHANAVENMPMFFILMIIAALSGMPVWITHVLGLMFTVGRGIHAWHFIQEKGALWQRFGGFGLALLANFLLALGIIGHGLVAVFGG